jgi:AraC family transcriptional regulator
MDHILIMVEAIDFIEANLKKPITIADMADAVSYSLYYFCRTFNQITQQTPYDYLIRRRLTEAAHELVNTEKKIIQIALEYKFNNPETFSRAFKRMFSVQPNQYRKRGSALSNILMGKITQPYLQHLNKGDFLRSQLEDRESFQVVGLMAWEKNGPNVPSELWKNLSSVLQDGSVAVESCHFFGISWSITPEKVNERCYFLGYEIKGLTPHGPRLTQKTIPASRYARFIHKGITKEIPLSLFYIHHTWLPKSGHHVSQPFLIEEFGPEGPSSDHPGSERNLLLPIQ